MVAIRGIIEGSGNRRAPPSLIWELTAGKKDGTLPAVDQKRLTAVMRGLGTGELKHPRFTKEEAATSGEVVHERLPNSKSPYLQVAKAKRNGQRGVIGKNMTYPKR